MVTRKDLSLLLHKSQQLLKYGPGPWPEDARSLDSCLSKTSQNLLASAVLEITIAVMLSFGIVNRIN